MSMTWIVPKSRLEDRAQSDEELKSDKPTIASLLKFASYLRPDRQRRQDQKAKDLAISNSNGRIAEGCNTSEQSPPYIAKIANEEQGVQHEIDPQVKLPPPNPEETLQPDENEGRDSLHSASAAQPSATCIALDEKCNQEPEATSTALHDAASNSKPLVVNAETSTSKSSQALETIDGDVQSSRVIGTKGEMDEETDQNDNSKSGVSNGLLVSGAPQAAFTTATSAPRISNKGKRPERPFNITVPASRLDRLLPFRIAPADTLKAQLVSTDVSTADHDRLIRFSNVLSSAKHRQELFGREIPLSRCSLVQVTEANSSPTSYICIQGLRAQGDITKFHSVMSQQRYQKLYHPLKLCYDTAKLTKVGSTERHIATASSMKTAAPSKRRLTTTLSPIFESIPTGHVNKLKPFEVYRPVSNDETYCGALFQTFVDGRRFMSTLGGTVEVGDSRYIMGCQHRRTTNRESMTDDSSTPDDFLGDDCLIPEDIEKPLVFATDDFFHGLDASQLPETNGVFPSTNDEWKPLSLDGVITVGKEWCLLPIQGHALLPNFVETPLKDDEGIQKRDRHYLDQISEPREGCPAFIATGSDSRPSGIVRGNSSFIFAGGTNGLVEVWTVELDDGQSIQKGDSGSWVIDTSDLMHYKVIGSAIATSSGAAHFVRIIDQFKDMEKNMEEPFAEGEIVTLAPAFHALVNCANLAFMNNDVKSDYLIDEALSPHVMEQFFGGWYMDDLKGFLNDDRYNKQQGSAGESLPGSTRRTVLKTLLLRYGCELLDSLLDLEDFKKCHANELSTDPTHWKTLMDLEAFLQRARTDEVTRRDVIAAAQTRGYGVGASSSYTHRNHQTNRAADGQRLQHSGAMRGSISKARLLGVLVLTVLAEGIASISGIAAAAAMHLIQFRNSIQPADLTVTNYVTFGAAIGPITATVMIAQILIIFSSRKARRLTKDHRYHSYRGVILVPCHVLASTLSSVAITIVSGVARMILPTLYVIISRGLNGNRDVFVAAAVAAVPSLLSAASPNVFWRLAVFYDSLEKSCDHGRIKSWLIVHVICSILVIGFDALAGYSFGRMRQNSGSDIPSPSSAATGAAVLSTLITILVSLPLIHLYLRVERGARLTEYPPRLSRRKHVSVSTNPEKSHLEMSYLERSDPDKSKPEKSYREMSNLEMSSPFYDSRDERAVRFEPAPGEGKAGPTFLQATSPTTGQAHEGNGWTSGAPTSPQTSNSHPSVDNS